MLLVSKGELDYDMTSDKKLEKRPTDNKRLFELMGKADIQSHGEVARRSALSAAAYSMIRTGNLKLSPKNAHNLCRTLNTTPQILYDILGIFDKEALEATNGLYLSNGPQGRNFLDQVYKMGIEEINHLYYTRDNNDKKQMLGRLFRLIGEDYPDLEPKFVDVENLLEVIVESYSRERK